MTPARIAELLKPFLGPAATPSHCRSESGQRPGEACPERSRREPAVLSPAQLQHISTYINLLLRWNARINLTAIRDPEDIVTRHFGESFFAARHLFPARGCREGEGQGFSRAVSAPEQERALAPEAAASDRPDGPTLADLGSGAGFPGLPIKLWAPNLHVTLIESNHKKAAFLRELARALTLTDVNIQTARAETLTGVSVDTVTLRAVERFDAILPVAARLVANAGRLALLISSAQFDRAQASLPQLSWSDPVPIPLSRFRVLAVASLK